MGMLKIGMELISTEGIKIAALNRRDGKSFDVIYDISGKPEKKIITPTLKGSFEIPKKSGVCRRSFYALRQSIIDDGNQIVDVGKTMFVVLDGLMNVAIVNNGLSLCFRYGQDFEYTTAPCKHKQTVTALFHKFCECLNNK